MNAERDFGLGRGAWSFRIGAHMPQRIREESNEGPPPKRSPPGRIAVKQTISVVMPPSQGRGKPRSLGVPNIWTGLTKTFIQNFCNQTLNARFLAAPLATSRFGVLKRFMLAVTLPNLLLDLFRHQVDGGVQITL